MDGRVGLADGLRINVYVEMQGWVDKPLSEMDSCEYVVLKY